jgi:DNA modification methylase
MTVNRLILGDNLEILKTLEAESIDLIYLDPPFFSNRNYEVIWGDAGEVRSFQDRWAGGIEQYIAWLKERVEQMYRIIKPTGSMFLHCDWHADAYIRVDILDRIFGIGNFRNGIIWKRTTAHNDSGRFGMNADSILYYTKSNKYTFNQQFQDYDAEYKKRFREDKNGRKFIDDNLSAKSLSGGGYEYEYKGVFNLWRCPIETMIQYDKEDKLYYTRNGGIRIKRYLDELQGLPCQTIWADINPVNSQAKERIGYPTQKPEALLERIIKCASNEGDLVLDPFMGGGTTIAVADRLNRQWIGVDQSAMAVKVTELRLQKQADLFSSAYTVQLHKYDYDTLRYKDAFQFEAWIIQQFGGAPNAKQRGDMGLDGKAADGAPIQVKRSDNIGRNVIDNFKSAVERFDKNLFEKNVAAKKPIGYIIAFSFGKGAVEEAARLKNKEDRIIKLVTVEEIIPIAVKPALGVHINELERDEKGVRKIELTAAGQSAAGIEFYSWDFTYDKEKGFKPSIIIDKDGRQTVSLKTGTHIIAVKVVDNDGLENVELITLKINGTVERSGAYERKIDS